MFTGFDVTTIRPVPNNGSPKRIYYDDSNIPDAYGPGISQAQENPFNGCDVPCHTWSNESFGDVNTINTWFFAREEYIWPVATAGCPITAYNDSTILPVNTSRDINVLTNDIGTELIDTAGIYIGFQPNDGLATFDSIALQASYTPNPGFVGMDTFSYVFCYGIKPVRNLCDSAWVYVTVTPEPENCSNMADDDGDGLIDCDDPDCQPLKVTNIYRKKQEFWWILFLLVLFFTPFSRNKINRKLPLTIAQSVKRQDREIK